MEIREGAAVAYLSLFILLQVEGAATESGVQALGSKVSGLGLGIRDSRWAGGLLAVELHWLEILGE